MSSKVTDLLRRPVLLYTGCAILGVALLIAVALYLMRGSHLELRGAIEKVRTLASDETHSLLIVDYRVTNLADVPWTGRHVALSIMAADGAIVEGNPVADVDAQRVFDYYPDLGGRLHPVWRTKETLAGRATTRRMVMAQFDLPEQELQKRRQIILRFDELDGAVSEVR